MAAKDIDISRQIAHVRIHAEHVTGHLKQFKILNTRITITQADLTDSMMVSITHIPFFVLFYIVNTLLLNLLTQKEQKKLLLLSKSSMSEMQPESLKHLRCRAMQQQLQAESCYTTIAARLSILDVCVGLGYLGLLWVLSVRFFSESLKKETNKRGTFSFKSRKFTSISGSLCGRLNLIQNKLYSFKKSK